MAGLGFLAAFFPDAIAPASDVLFLFSQKQQKQKKTRALTSQFDLVCFWGAFLLTVKRDTGGANNQVSE